MSDAPSMLTLALDYARRGWRVHPLHTPILDLEAQLVRCSCGDTHDGAGKYDADSIGKHPRLGGWQNVATTDETMIREWWGKWQDANIGIATGAASGLYVIDKDGPEAEESLAPLISETIETPTVLTGRKGGSHLYFQHPGAEWPLPNKCKTFAKGVDTRGDGGYVIAAGSLHPSGKRYRWAPGTESLEPALLPAPLFRAVRQEAVSAEARGVGDSPAGELIFEEIRKGNRHQALTRLAGHLLGVGHSEAMTREILLSFNQTHVKPPYEANAIERMVSDFARRDRGKPPRESDVKAKLGTSKAVLIQLSTIQPKRTEWVWRNRIPIGNYSLIDGWPGLGKSQLMIDVAARVTKGWSMPDGTPGVQGRVIILTAEDDLAATIVPRLEAAGADLTLVHEMRVEYPDGTRMPPSFPENVLQLRDAVTTYGDVRLVVIDPVTAFLSGEINSHKEQDVRRVFHLLKDAAEEHAFALTGIRHLNKNKGGSAIDRGGGSIGFVAGARAASLVSRHPEDPERRVLACVKNNLGPEPTSLTFHLEEVPIKAGWTVSRVKFDGTTHHTANDLIAAAEEDAGARTERKEAGEWLTDYLGDGQPHGAETIFAEGDKLGHSRRTLQRALREVHARRTRPKVPGPWYYTLERAIRASDSGMESVASMASMRSMERKVSFDEDAA